MKKVRLIVSALLLVVFALSLSACFLHIKDTNGDDDFTIQTIDDDEIIQSNKNIAMGAVTTHVGNDYTVKIKRLSGVMQVADLSLQGIGQAVIRTDMDVKSGNCRLVLVHGNNIIYDFELHGEDSYTVRTSGTYYLKLVGESAKVTKLNFSWTLA